MDTERFSSYTALGGPHHCVGWPGYHLGVHHIEVTPCRR